MKSNQKMTLLFWHRKSKADTNGHAPIICRISIDGQDEEMSIGKKVHIDNWDVDAKMAIGSKEARVINQKISSMTSDLQRHFTILQMEYLLVTPLMLKNVYNGLPCKQARNQPKLQPVANTLLQIANAFVADFEKMTVKKLRSKETLRHWRSTVKKISEFVQYRYNSVDIELSEIDYFFAEHFYNYLTLEREPVLQEVSAKGQLKKVKQLFFLAEKLNCIPKNPIQQFRCGSDETDIPPLEFQEVLSIWKKQLPITRLEEVRDVFIFQCFTGFAFQDVYGLTEDHIVSVGLKGEMWLIKERGKTDVTEMVPIMPIVDEIIKKYQSHPCRKLQGRLLPVNSNARYNGYLKEIGTICGIKRELHTHLARHTFADMMLNIFEFSLEEVSKMLGHINIRTTQRYVKVRKVKISKTWAKARSIVFKRNGELKPVANY